MAVAMRVPAFVAGTLFVLGGTAMATYVGPDDTLEIGTHTVPESAAGLAVATHPEITQFTGIDMLVRVSAPSGVWVGTSHRVDTMSLLEGVGHYEISRMALNTVGGRMVEGAEAGTRRALRPQRLTGWRDQAYGGPDDSTGDPVAEVVVPLDGTPTDVVAVPDRRDERITLTIGVHWGGLFRAQLLVAGAGVALLLLGFFLSWRARRGAGPAPEEDPQVEEVAPAPLVEEPDTFWDRPVGRSLPRSLLPVTVVALLALGGCTLPGPAAAPTEADPAQRIALTPAEAADLGGATPVTVHAPEFATYPMWAVVELAEPPRLRLLTRESFRTRWERVATVRVTRPPASVSPPRSPGPQVVRQADRAVQRVQDFWTTGEPQGLRIDRRTRRARQDLLGDGSAWGAVGEVRVVEAKRGWLVVVQHTVATPAAYDLTSVVLLSGEHPRLLGSRLSAG